LFTGALNEAEFIDMRLSPQRSRAGILYDIKWCQEFEGSNTALVVLTGVGNVLWSNDEQARQRPWRARYGDWNPTRSTSAGPPFPPWISSDMNEGLWAADAQGSPTQTVAPLSPSTPGRARFDSRSDYILEFGQLSVTGHTAHIYIGHIEGLDGAPPDMGEFSDREIIAGFPQWSSMMAVHEHHKYLGPLNNESP
jgi:hypothetical protein